jgi:hypothetical protein
LEYSAAAPFVLAMDEVLNCLEDEMVFDGEVVAVVNDLNGVGAWIEFDPLPN